MRQWDIPEVSGNGAALGSVLTILVGMKNFHYLSEVNMHPSSVLTWCQYRRTASLKVRMFLQNMHIDFFPFLLTVDIKEDREYFFPLEKGMETTVEGKITWSGSISSTFFYGVNIFVQLNFLVSCLSSFPKSTHKNANGTEYYHIERVIILLLGKH